MVQKHLGGIALGPINVIEIIKDFKEIMVLIEFITYQ